MADDETVGLCDGQQEVEARSFLLTDQEIETGAAPVPESSSIIKGHLLWGFSIFDEDEQEGNASQNRGGSYGLSNQDEGNDFLPNGSNASDAAEENHSDDEEAEGCLDGAGEGKTALQMEDIPVGSFVMVQGGYSFGSVYRARVVSHISADTVEIQWLDRGDRAKVSIEKVLEKFELAKPKFSKRPRRKTRRLVEAEENKAKKRYVPRSRLNEEVLKVEVSNKVVKKRCVPRIRIKIAKAQHERPPRIVRRWHLLREPTTITAIIRNINFVSNYHREESELSDAEPSWHTQETKISQKFEDYEHLLIEET